MRYSRQLLVAVVLVLGGVGSSTPSSSADVLTVGGGYWSSGCDAGPGVFDGYINAGVYVKLRTLLSGGRAYVCTAFEGPAFPHVGLRVSIPAPGVPTVDSNQAACSDPENEPYRVFTRSVTASPTDESLAVDVNVFPSEVWMCVGATSTPGLAWRVVVPLTTSPPEIAIDTSTPGGYVAQPPTDPSQPSAWCQVAVPGTRQLNAEVGPTHVWLYTYAAPDGTRTVCVRVEGPVSGGGRLTVTGPGGLPFVASTDLTPCTFNVLTDYGPPPSSIRLSPPDEGFPASVCVSIAGIDQRLTVDAVGPLPTVTWTPDS